MTKAEWLSCCVPEPMLHFLERHHAPSDRKLRLFAVACCRLMFTKISVTRRYVEEVEVGERYADGRASTAELSEARLYSNSAAEHACMNTTETDGTVGDYDPIVMADCAALNAAWGTTQPGPIKPDDNGLSQARLEAEQAIQSNLLRDIFAPFGNTTIRTSWLVWNDATVHRIVLAIYDERAFKRMPVLADALEDAGCDNADILAHCRGPGPHVRGCWVVDLLLGKS
jgi:hypothetical protein